MNTNIKIKEITQNNPNLVKDVESLSKFIKLHLFKERNREKIDEFFTTLHEILNKFFGTDQEVNKAFYEKYDTTVNLLGAKNVEFGEYDAIVQLFHADDGQNFFSVVNNGFDNNLKYVLPLEVINSYIFRKSSQLFQQMDFFQYTSLAFERQRDSLSQKQIAIFNALEFFFVVFLISIRNNGLIHKVNLLEKNENLKKVFKNPKKFLKDNQLTTKNFEELFSNRSLTFNFYVSVFKSYINFFSENIYSVNNLKKLNLITSAINLIWLSHYVHQISFTRKDTYSNLIKNIDFSPNPPNIIILECLKNLITGLQSKNLLYRYNKEHSHVTLNPDSILFSLTNNLYFFFKINFFRISSNNSFTDTTLFDIVNVWFEYINPWFNNPIAMFPDSNDSYEIANKMYVYSNILLYTDLFNDYIAAFSNLIVLSINDLKQLKNILEIFSVSGSSFINGLVDINILNDFSKGKFVGRVLGNNSAGQMVSIMENHVNFIGISRAHVFQFDSEVF